MKYVIALLATLVALPALAHGPKVTVDADPGSGITNIGDRYSVMLDFDLIAELGSAGIDDLGEVSYKNGATTPGVGDSLVWTNSNGPAHWENVSRQFYQITGSDPLIVQNWAASGFGIGGGAGSGCALQTWCWSMTDDAFYKDSVLQPNTVLAPIALPAESPTPNNSIGTVFTTQNTSPTSIDSFHGMPHGAEFSVVFKDAVTSVVFSEFWLKGNNGVDWGPAAVDDVMMCTKNDNITYCQVPSSAVDGGSADSGTLPFTLGNNDEFVFDAGGNLTLGVAGAGINISPPTATGGQLVLPSSLNSGGSAFTLKVHDLGLTNPVNCIINTNGELDAGCPLIPSGQGGGGISEDYAAAAQRAIQEHRGYPSALTGLIATNWQPILDPSVAIFISGDFDPDINDLTADVWDHYTFFETVVNGDPTNIQADPTLTGPADCTGSRLNAWTCADAIQLLNPGTYEITITMIADKNNILPTQRTDPAQTLAPVNMCAPWWYVDNNYRLFQQGVGGQVEPSINATRSTASQCDNPLETGIAVCETLNVWATSARADVTVSSTAGLSAYLNTNILTSNSSFEVVYDNTATNTNGGAPYWRTVRGLSTCTWDKAMGVIIVEVRKTS